MIKTTSKTGTKTASELVAGDKILVGHNVKFVLAVTTGGPEVIAQLHSSVSTKPYLKSYRANRVFTTVAVEEW